MKIYENHRVDKTLPRICPKIDLHSTRGQIFFSQRCPKHISAVSSHGQFHVKCRELECACQSFKHCLSKIKTPNLNENNIRILE